MTRKCPAHGFQANELLDIFYNGLTEGTRCYLDSIAGNVFRGRTIEEATELLDMISRNYEDWKMEDANKEELFSKKKPGILKLTDETMMEASESIKEKGIKTWHLKELSEMGIKLHIDQPCFPIQVNAICPTNGNETPYLSYVNDFSYDSKPEEHYIRMNLMKNSHEIKSLGENLSAKVDAIKGLVKRCEMMNNQVEQMISPENQLYENFIEKKQVCGVNTRGGATPRILISLMAILREESKMHSKRNLL
jgi:hypothetical protein